MDTPIRMIRFGPDGWHAFLGDEDFSQNILRIVSGFCELLSHEGARGGVLVAFDTREGFSDLAKEAAGICASQGFDAVLFSDPCPTPVLGWALKHTPGAVGGIVLTASGRSYKHGGILLRNFEGGPLSRNRIDRLESLIPKASVRERGSYVTADGRDGYLEALCSFIDEVPTDAGEGGSERDVLVIADVMYGTAAAFAPALCEHLGCKVQVVHDGLCIDSTDDAGFVPTAEAPYLTDCREKIRAAGADMGIAWDADADRLALLDETGEVLPVFLTTALVLESLTELYGMTGDVVTTVACSDMISRDAEAHGCDVLRVPVGFERLYLEAGSGNMLLGAEEYGGICVPAFAKNRDGLLAAALVLRYVLARQCPLSKLVQEFYERMGSNYYAQRDVYLEAATMDAVHNILPGVNPAAFIGRSPVQVSHVDGLGLNFADGARILLRPSRGSNVLRLYAEAPDKREAEDLLDTASSIIFTYI